MAVIATAVAASAVSMWLTVLPATAGAAIQLGQLSPVDPTVCSAGNYIQSSGSTPPYTVPPPGGVITRWSHRGKFVKQEPTDKTPPAGSGRLQVWRRVGAGFQLLGRSGVETFTPSVETTYLTRIAVGTGDQLGMRAEARTGCRHNGGKNDHALGDLVGDAEPGDFASPSLQFFPDLLNVSAVLEPDADADGFGDESQDGCPGQAGPESGCPPGTAPPPGDGDDGGGGDGGGGGGDGDGPPGFGTPSNEFSFGKLKKNKRKGTAKLTVEVPGPGALTLTETDEVKGTGKQADAAGDEKLAVKPKAKAKRKLNRKGKAKLGAEVTYTPELGASNTDSKTLKLRKR
jgi:hypothetical protein